MNDFEKPYEPKNTEEKIYKLWEKSGYFNPDKLPNQNGKPRKKTFTIFLPPPNVTGTLHMGHALNATIEDILIRQKRMQGYRTLWVPGTDHAGIATQNVVEKTLRKEGVSRFELGREKFLEKVWEWKEQYGNTILGQLKRIGASADWSRTRFTMDEDYAKWVKKAFVHYYEKGLIYRGKRVVSWCPRCGTSLSDLEIEHREEKGSLYFIKYPIKEGGHITVATTRPETMLGDTAVAVNPKDERYKDVIGKTAIIPVVNREVPIIADQKIDRAFGTGAVKITPAHDLLDAEIGERHKLPIIQVIDERAKMTAETGPDFVGLRVIEAREKIVALLTEHNFIEKIEAHLHNVNICYRCNTVIEPIPSAQWYVKMDQLSKTSLTQVKSKKVKFTPKNFEKPYLEWLKNIKDWCISRQIWWGHQLPVYFCENQPEKFSVAEKKPKQCSFCKNCEMKQSTDVLDTWFSSALWPFATLSEKDQKIFYPSQVLSTARDIINLWVARMIFSGMEFKGKAPFSDVLIHGTILTKDGQRMSKSKGTGIDPLILIDQYGADATRFGLIWQAMGNQDIRWDETAVMAGKKFANKIWNATRFVLGQIKPESFSKKINKAKLTAADKRIINKLAKTKKSVEKDIDKYQFGKALHTIYDFFWHDYCDKYLEEFKLQKGTPEVLALVLIESLKLLHPFMPFVTEEIYQNLPVKKGKGEPKMLIVEKW